MKLNKYIGLAAMAVAFSACQQDMLEGENMQNGIYTLSGNMAGGAAMSRAQIVLGNTDASAGEKFFWNEGDSFTVYQGENDNYTEHVFTIKDYTEEGEGDKKTASFVTNNPVSPGEIIAVYPSGMEMDYDQEIMKVGMDFQTELDFGQGTVEAVWKDYFRNNMVMKAKATLTEGGNNTLSFEHLTSLARITYNNQSGKDQNVTEIIFGGDQTFGFSKTVWFKYDIIGGNSSNGYRINYKNLTVKDGESFDFYILFGPNDFREGDMHIHIHTAQTDVNREPLKLPTATIAAANNNATKFEAGKRYWFKVTETSSELVWSKDFSSDVVTIKNAQLSQALYGVLGADKVSLNSDNYAVMNKADVEAVTTLDFNNKGYTITSLAGIENFVNLDDLRCNSVGLVSCDLSKNTALKVLMLSSNPLEGVLNLSNNAKLEVLYLQGCGSLSSVKLDNCTKLGFVCLTSTRSLTSFDIPNKAGVYFLDYSSSSLNFNLSEFTGLTTLKCSFKGLTELNLSDEAKSKLTFIECSGNNLGDLDLSGYTSLETFSGFNAGITSLNVSKAVNLKKLWCFQNNMQNLDITFLNNLEEVRCGKQLNDAVLLLHLTEAQKAKWETTWNTDAYNINVNLKVETLVTINNAELSTVLYSMFGASKVKLENGNAVMTKSFAESVIELNLYKRSLTSLDGIGVFKNLVVLNCEENALTTLDLSQLPKLKNLNCVSNKLAALDLSYCPELTNLRCSKNQLANISVNHLKNLVELDIIENQLTSLDVSSLTKLKGLYCFKNHLQTLDLSACIALTTMQLGTQTDKDGKDVILKLKLSDASMESWTSKWASDGSNKNVELVTGPSVETGSGNTGGSDFTIEGIY